MIFQNQYFRNSLVLFLAYCTSAGVTAQETADTSKIVRNLQEVEVSAIGRPSFSRSTAPLQLLQSSELEKINALEVADAVKFFSGVQVKDYGGIGGLKTISVRNLGANYISISYDGIPVSDYQTGQIDLGRFSLDNVSMIQLNTGESDDLFRTAHAMASAGALQIITANGPDTASRNRIKASLKTGSLGLINPSLSIAHNLNRSWSLGLTAEWLKTNGDYKFRQYYGYNNDSSSVEKRNNSDVDNRKLEANLYGRFRNGGSLALKACYHHDDRGLPGPATYYNSYSGERLDVRNVFSQANYTQSLTDRLDFMTNLKFSYSDMDYVDIRSIYPNGRKENAYFQREYYTNATFRYSLSPVFSLAWATDYAYGNLSNNLSNCVFPYRITWLNSFSAKYECSYLVLTTSITGNSTTDKAKLDNRSDTQRRISPYTGFSWQLSDKLPLRIRGYYKHTFRMPTFGDLYYSSVPPADLKPENADQYDLGLTWIIGAKSIVQTIGISLDAYLNRIENKIVALPVNSMFLWSVQNYGKVLIKGADLNLETRLVFADFSAHLKSVYTYQRVTDRTLPDTKMYNQQLPYTPIHSLSGILGIETPWLEANYTLLYCGKRYYERINRPEYHMEAYADQGISLVKTIAVGKMKWRLTAECLNLFNAQYEVVRSYPMPGRTFRVGAKLEIRS
ncbi:MAG: TonB-dependent receptor [Dysgonamonadaceae bacterium]|jgi:outer membrane cobalamin receptor|nr:TonB-dependent receptor [Dysgonamonadaceae bacterium]